MKKIILSLLIFYKKFISPILVVEFGYACKSNPTCSEYTVKAVDKNGVLKGGWMALIRLSKCK